MKRIYWNLRGLANSPTRLSLRNHIRTHKLDFCFVVEPFMNLQDLPNNYINSLDLKIFDCNTRYNLLTNLWCMYKKDLNPQVVTSSYQHVSFKFVLDFVQVGFHVVYASTHHINRRNLWLDISSLLNNHVPWCIIGDFNAISGSHEHKGSHTPNKVHM